MESLDRPRTHTRVIYLSLNVICAGISWPLRRLHRLICCEGFQAHPLSAARMGLSEPPNTSAPPLFQQPLGENRLPQKHNTENIHQPTAERMVQLMEKKGEQALQLGELGLVGELIGIVQHLGMYEVCASTADIQRLNQPASQVFAFCEAGSDTVYQSSRNTGQILDSLLSQLMPIRRRLTRLVYSLSLIHI